MLAKQPELATDQMEHWCDHPLGADPLGYLAMLRFDSRRLDLPADLPKVGVMTRALIDAGAPVNGGPGAAATPLITATSYGDAEVARILIAAGADLEATEPAAGGTALHHAAVFGMTGVLDVLVAAGARIHDVVEAAAGGDVTGWLTADTPLAQRISALRLAAGHERLGVMDELPDADPARRDTTHHSTPKDWCRHHRGSPDENGAQDEVEAILGPLAAEP